MKCENCQEPLADTDAFCPECGTRRPVDRRCVHCGTPVKEKQKFCSCCGKSPELRCPACGASVKTGQKFCRGCGQKIEEAVKEFSCSNCGAAVEKDGQFCSNCGTPREQGSAALQTPTPCDEKQATAAVTPAEDDAAAIKQNVESNSPLTDDGTVTKEGDKTKSKGDEGGEQQVPDKSLREQAAQPLLTESEHLDDLEQDKNETSEEPKQEGSITDGEKQEGSITDGEKQEGSITDGESCLESVTDSSESTEDAESDKNDKGLPAPTTDDESSGHRDIVTNEEGRERAQSSSLKARESNLDEKQLIKTPVQETNSDVHEEDLVPNEKASKDAQDKLLAGQDPSLANATPIHGKTNSDGSGNYSDSRSDEVPDNTASGIQYGLDVGHGQDPSFSCAPPGYENVDSSEIRSEESSDNAAPDAQNGLPVGQDLSLSNAQVPSAEPKPTSSETSGTGIGSQTQILESCGGINDHATGAAASLKDDGDNAGKNDDNIDSGSEKDDEERNGDDGASNSRDRSQQEDPQKKKGRRKRHVPKRKRKQQKREVKLRAEIVSQTSTVRFHVVISKKFKQLEVNNHRVYLSWKQDVKHPNPDDLVQMHRMERSGDSGELYEGSVETTKLPKNSHRIWYKYCLELNGEYEWEKIYHQKEKCRELRVPNQLAQQTGTWDVYDWVAYPGGMTGVTDTIRHWTRFGKTSSDIFQHDLSSACGLFLPSPDTIVNTLCTHVDSRGQSAEEFLKTIRIIAASTGDETFMADCVDRFLLGPVLQSAKRVISDDQRTVVLAMFLMHLAEDMKLGLVQDDRSIIFRALLIKPDVENKKCPDIGDLFNHFPILMRDKQNVLKKIMFLFMKNKGDPDPSWMYTVPLLHLLCEEHTPFNALLPSEMHRSTEWWGVVKLNNKVRAFKEATKESDWSQSLKSVYYDLSAAFQADPLMLRTYVATLNLRQLLGLFSIVDPPPEIVMASLFYHLHENKDAGEYQYQMEIVDILRKTAVIFKTTAGSDKQVSVQEAKRYKEAAYVGVDLLQEVTETHRRPGSLVHSVVCLQLTIIAVLSRDDVPAIRSGGTSMQVIMNNTKLFMGVWIREFQYKQVSQEYFKQMMEEIFQLVEEIANVDMATSLKTLFSGQVKKYISQLHALDKLSACLELIEGQGPVSDIITSDTYTYLEQALLETEVHAALDWLSSGCFQANVFKEKMSKLFKTKWNEKYPGENGLLELIFNWKPLMILMKTLQRNETFWAYLTDDVAKTVDNAFNFSQKLVDRIARGRIKISEVNWLWTHQQQFCEVVNTVHNDRGRAWCGLQLRKKELDAFQRLTEDVNCVLRFSQTFIVTADAMGSYERFRDESGEILTDQLIADICENPPAPDPAFIERYIPKVLMNAVPERFRIFLPVLAVRHNSAVYQDMLKKSALAETICPEDKFWNVLAFVWHEAETEWKSTCDSLRSGRITLQEAEKLFSVLEKNNKWFEKCKAEVQKMAEGESDQWVAERMEQLQCLTRLSTQRAAATILCQIKEEFGFTGDDENVRTFQEVDMEQPIGQLNLSIVETSKVLQDIDNETVQHFKHFGSDKCNKFVKWVRETMEEEGMKEVKVFVDMALNYVGDDQKEMDKVHNLRAVITGYAPLIFQKGAETFLDRCSEVARNIKTDNELPAKLESTAQMVDWFDSIHKFHGSVEKTAMAQVNSITSTGILKLGKLQHIVRKGVDVDFCDVMCLEVPSEDEDQSEGKTYSYDDLVDLQSRLMLVAGHEEQGKASVDKFISVMDSVVRLVKTYIQLCRSGCLLFFSWTVKFFFGTRGVCCIVEFFQGHDGAKQLKGIYESYTLEDYMAEVAGFLDSSLDSWLSYVAKQRHDYEELNIFTMNQLVFLQEQLGLLESGDNISRHVYPLLCLLLPECSDYNLTSAMEQAAEMEVTPKEDKEKEEKEEEETDQETKTAALFIQQMIENGFPKQLAVKALQNDVDPRDFEEGMVWCMSNADEEDNGNDVKDDDLVDASLDSSITRTSPDSPMKEGTIASALQLLDSLTGNLLSLDALAANLAKTWTLFLDRVKFSGEDYLSLHHLGIVLRALAEQDSCEYNRKLPPPMATDTPNLIVCPKGEVLKTVTSLYMFTEDAPLPQSDEVLLCTPSTTSEEVGIFLRRAFSTISDQMGKIHCLVFADSVNYDVGQQTEKDLKEFMNTTQHPYQLVVICTSENEFNSRITASLERFRRPPPLTAGDTKKMQNYLFCKFTVSEDVSPRRSAACVDPDRLCVRVVKSTRSGMGKTLYKKRLVSKLRTLIDEDDDESEEDSDEESEDEEDSDSDSEASESGTGRHLHVTVPLYEKHVNSHHVADTLLQRLPPSRSSRARLIHLDIAYEVQEGVDLLLYNLLVLGCITNVHGQVWRRSASDLYLIEAMPLHEHTESQQQKFLHQMFSILPSVKCCSPSESLHILANKRGNATARGDHALSFDEEECRSTVFQRPFHYLSALNSRSGPKPYNPRTVLHAARGNEGNCLQTLISHCGVKNPSWSELYHFVSFLNKQLEDFEHSIFCSSELSMDLPGFPAFVLRFLIYMSTDFATRSIEMAEESLPVLNIADLDDDDDDDTAKDTDGIEQFQMRRTWESSPHPYIFFNPDQTSMTFLGFTVDPRTGSLLDQAGGVLQAALMRRALYDSLAANGAPLSEDFDSLPRNAKLQRLYQVMGVPASEAVVDPDDTYELTTDNAKKILAIYMRFRCNIPVIIMGETGCGKTRLVSFMCALQTPKNSAANTMVIMKVHGGTTAEDIHKKVREAETLAKERKESTEHEGPGAAERPIYTVLFFDEANTTEAIGAIKEVMCDGAMNGKPINLHHNLKMVAACNPYRKHSQAVIQRLEKAGLGYHISAEKTCDKLGRVPMRQLVYRVQPLPQSMLPLVWDFGQLDTDTESMYIRQMVLRYNRQRRLGDFTREQYETLCRVLVMSQKFMRSRKDECSFVSLRDADRTLMVTCWFLQQVQLLDKVRRSLGVWHTAADITLSLVLALAVCYRAGLPNKHMFEEQICIEFRPHFILRVPEFRRIIDSCQNILLEYVNVGERIARNQALKENVFMMVVCVEMGIPLFLVGKPGSSKSLAKAIVADAMQGKQAKGDLFKTLKEIQMVSFQCSPLATADGILGTFRQCAKIQHGKDRSKFVAVAVLDEIGLAEDSPRMPLKALHPLLEDGYEVEEEVNSENDEGKPKEEEVKYDDEEVEEAEGYFGEEVTEDESAAGSDSESEKEKDGTCMQPKRTRVEKVAFIGISNWALDPAKMNRGILVQRDVPDKEELAQTAESICSSGRSGILNHVKSLVRKLARAYLEVFEQATQQREFFGLRDFYSLVKMVHAIATRHNRKLTKTEFQATIRRNFGGLDEIDPVAIFEEHLSAEDTYGGDVNDNIDSSYSALLHMALGGDGFGGESRYLLLLTENYGGLHILTDNLLVKRNIVPIFGSSFPKDQEYTQICRNINRIKVCMETGKTVVLLNLDNLYESLYDALNQYYSYLAKARYVDLGLGTHRVKCKVDKEFRLIVVAEKQTVYAKFPIPLINRLEKHFLTVNNLLSDEQRRLERQLKEWVQHIVCNGTDGGQLAVNDVVIGYHSDTAASIVLRVWVKHVRPEHELTHDAEDKILRDSQAILLWCATPDAVIRLQEEWCSEVYFMQQQHDSLAHYLKAQLQTLDDDCLMAQVTTHSKMLTDRERSELEQQLPGFSFTLLSLQAFHTEQQFQHQLSLFLGDKDGRQKVLMVQCERGDVNQNLLQCAQYCLQCTWSQSRTKHHVVFIVQLPRVASTVFSGFMGGRWHCAHVDDLRSPACTVPTVSQLQETSPAQLLASAVPSHTPEEVQSEEKREGMAEPVPCCLSLDFAGQLMMACVQGAVARIRDGAGDGDRSTHRIALLLHCLENRGHNLFLYGVLKMVSAVLREKEAVSGDPRESVCWLSRDAANPQWVKRSGTMRRAWMQCLERHIVPALAGVVAYLDTNHNLDLLQEDGLVREFWLQILNDPTLCQLQYSDLLSMSGRHSQLQEFACRATFQPAELASPALPFSWMIAEQIEAFLTKTPEMDDDEAVCEAVEGSAIGRHLQELSTADDSAAQFLDRYVSDLLHVHFRLNPNEHQLLMQCMRAALAQDGSEVQRQGLSRVLVRVHQLMVTARPRLQAVLDMAACHPHAIQALQEKRRDPQTFRPDADPELVEDVLLLQILSQELTPQKNQLNTDEGCRTWLDLHNTVAPVISRMLADADNHLAIEPFWQDEDMWQGRNGSRWFLYGPWCRENIENIRFLWTKVSTVKLFIDYMSPLVQGKDSVRVDPINYNLLWNILGPRANLKTKETLTNVDRYLKHANTQMVKILLGDVGSCAHCAVKLEGPPTELPCTHRICNKCYTQEVRTSNQCPECHVPVPANFRPDEQSHCDKAAVDRLVSFQRQTSAFLMAVVSQLCFAGQEPPEPEAVEHIFSYVIKRVEGVTTLRTQQLTLRDDQMDPSPVLRSFILRLLLKHSEVDVSDHIDQFLSEARNLIEEHVRDDNQQSSSVLIELSLLIIHCTENLEYEAEANAEDRTVSMDFPTQCQRVKEQLHSIRMKLESSALELPTLTALGQLRHALSVLAAVLHTHVIEPSDRQDLHVALKDLLMEAAIICTMGVSPWPKNFLVKQLCREFGLQSYATLMQRAQTHRSLQWIKLDNIQQVEEVPDRYLVCGAEYNAVRKEVMHEMRGQQGQLRVLFSEMNISAEKKQYLFMLALHREVAMAFATSSLHTQAEIKERASTLVKSRKVEVDEAFAQRVVSNTLGVDESVLCVAEDRSLAEQSVGCVLTHLWLALRSQPHQLDLLALLVALIDEPASMMNSYIPTMPQDNVDEIIRALRIDHSKTIADYTADVETPKLWQCPKGHRYAIGNCGNPTVKGACPECGVQIGGVHYNVAATGNKIAQVTDRTQPGHTLGAAEDRSREVIPERGMSAAACALVRFLTHATLLISASQPGQAATVAQMIRPAIRETEVTAFFLGHLVKDLQVLERVLGRCCDDVYLLLHHVCHQLAQLPSAHFWYTQLGSKRDREDWEKQFTTTYIQPVLQQIDSIVQHGNELLLEDNRQGQNQLLNLVFEVGEEDSEADVDLQQTPAPWKYRTRITVDHFFRQFQLHIQSMPDGRDSLPVLKLFHDETHHLRALHYVPDILALQRHVLQQLRHRLTRVETSKTAVRELLNTKESPELQRLIEVFSKAWDIVRDFLFSYRCRTSEGTVVQLPENCHTLSVSESSPVGMLLPDTEGPGRCAYLLIHYLLVQHNYFLERYCPHTRQKYEELPEVQLHMITKHHLVSYSPQADLLPLVLAHCNYSLHLGHGDNATSTKLDYDFLGFELQLRNTLLLSKSRVQRGQHGAMEMETMIYCADTTNSRLVNKLREKVGQEPMSVRVQRQIASEFRESLPDICQAIDRVNTTLTFLLTLKVTADQSLHAFMVDTLRMKDIEGIYSRKAQQHCRVKHVQSLWLLLCFLRARILAANGQEAFDDQGSELRKELTEEQKEGLNDALQRLTADRVELVLTQVYECILLRLMGHSEDEDFASPDNYSLQWLVCDSLENSLYTETETAEDAQQDLLTAEDLKTFPDSVIASQAIPAWVHVLNHLNRRQQ